MDVRGEGKTVTDSIEGLAESMKKVGLINPIRLEKNGDGYKGVAGSRRFRAAKLLKWDTIPAVVAADNGEGVAIALAENTQREEVDPFYEAITFAKCEDVDEVAAIIGKSRSYVLRRQALVNAPEWMKKYYNEGTFSLACIEEMVPHFENTALMEAVKGYGKYNFTTLKDLKERIRNHEHSLTGVFFDVAPCTECPSNSARQRDLFALDTKGKKCLNPECFEAKQTEALLADWPKHRKRFKVDTNSAVMFDSDNRQPEIHGKVKKQCKECDQYCTILWPHSLNVYGAAACSGTKECFDKNYSGKKESKEGGSDKNNADAPRVSWHGEFFREQFYKERILAVLANDVPYGDPRFITLALCVMAHRYDAVRRVIFPSKKDALAYHISADDCVKRILKMDITALEAVLKDSLPAILLSDEFTPTSRHLIAPFIGIDLAKEWAPTDEWYAKKKRVELTQYVIDNKLPIKDADTLKKTGLIAALKELNLTGVVPGEITGAGNGKHSHSARKASGTNTIPDEE